MNNPVLSEVEMYTYQDYLDFPGPERYELIDGEAYLMAGPSPIHQEIIAAIVAQLFLFLEGKKCKVYPAPFDVRLFEQDEDSPENVDTVVQPDITVICDTSKIDDRGCKGAPEMVIEVLSPSNSRHDRLVKLNLYQRAGVKEFWIVSPEERSAQVFLLDGDILRPHEVYTPKDIAKVNTLQGCFIEMCKVFPESR